MWLLIVTLSGLLAGAPAARAGSMSVTPSSGINIWQEGSSGDSNASYGMSIQGSDPSFLRNGSDYAWFSYKWTAQASADKTWLASPASVTASGAVFFDFSNLPPALWTIDVACRYYGVAAVSNPSSNQAWLDQVRLSAFGLADSLPMMTLPGATQTSTGATFVDLQDGSETTVLGSGSGHMQFEVGLQASSNDPEAYAGLGRMSGMSFFGLDDTYYNPAHGLYVTLVFTPSLDLAGHVLNEPLNLESGEVLSGYGTVNGAISAAAGSTIRPTGSGLVIGDIGSVTGFDFDGSVDVTQGNLEVRDLDVATFCGTAAVGNSNTLTVSSGLDLDGCTMTVADSGRVEAGPTMVVQSTGTVNLNGGTVVADTVDHTHGGTFSFTGGVLQADTFQGDLTNTGGTLAPGGSTGTTTVQGNYTQAAGGTLEIELAGASDYDVVDATGSASLNGTLDVTSLGSFNPYGHSFTILTAAGGVSGEFSDINGPVMDITYNAYDVVILATLMGDASFDGCVDGADYTAWADHYGQSGGWRDGDFSGDGFVDGADYTAWADHYGDGCAAAGSAVPEPGCAGLLAFGALAGLKRRLRK